MEFLDRILDVFRPQWRCSVKGVRMDAVGHLSPDKQSNLLRRILEKDPSCEVQMVAAERIGENSELVQLLMETYKQRLDERSIKAMVLLGKANPQLGPDVAKLMASNIFFIARADDFEESETQQNNKILTVLFRVALGQGELLCFHSGLLSYLAGPHPILRHAVPELRDTLATLERVFSERGKTEFEIIATKPNGQLFLTAYRRRDMMERLRRGGMNFEFTHPPVELIGATFEMFYLQNVLKNAINKLGHA